MQIREKFWSFLKKGVSLQNSQGWWAMENMKQIPASPS